MAMIHVKPREAWQRPPVADAEEHEMRQHPSATDAKKI
jgi:hypothetical protein